MIEFTLDELMEIHRVMTSHYCDPMRSEKVNIPLMEKMIALIEDATLPEKKEEVIHVEL